MFECENFYSILRFRFIFQEQSRILSHTRKTAKYLIGIVHKHTKRENTEVN